LDPHASTGPEVHHAPCKQSAGHADDGHCTTIIAVQCVLSVQAHGTLHGSHTFVAIGASASADASALGPV
jgi:hypothetical protein